MTVRDEREGDGGTCDLPILASDDTTPKHYAPTDFSTQRDLSLGPKEGEDEPNFAINDKLMEKSGNWPPWYIRSCIKESWAFAHNWGAEYIIKGVFDHRRGHRRAKAREDSDDGPAC
ncbi:hypothetical protein RSAG8_11463, partial [Rhizoctonia solani AG-8 WAC10335]